METVVQFLAPAMLLVRRAPEITLLIGLGIVLLQLALLIQLTVRQRRIAARQQRLWRAADGRSLETMLLEHLQQSEQVQSRLNRLETDLGSISAQLSRCLHRVGLVRYNAFANTGGDQSFSVALLDDRESGLVISGLYSRQDMRVYVKPVGNSSSNSRSSAPPLTEEERSAIAQAVAAGADANAGSGTDVADPRQVRR